MSFRVRKSPREVLKWDMNVAFFAKNQPFLLGDLPCANFCPRC